MDTQDYSNSQVLLRSLISPQFVVFLKSTTKEAALEELIDHLCQQTPAIESLKRELLGAILTREHLVSTGIGVGVALPHAKLSGLHQFYVLIGVLAQGVDWQSLDGAPARLVVLVLGPEQRQAFYLQLLSKLTYALKDEERRKKILNLSVPEEIVKVFSG